MGDSHLRHILGGLDACSAAEGGIGVLDRFKLHGIGLSHEKQRAPAETGFNLRIQGRARRCNRDFH
jgi:hypothetical protein